MFGGSWQTYDHYFYAAVAVLGTFAASGAIHLALRHPRLGATARSLHGVAPPFINIVGVLFGLTLAFLANDTWSAHDRAITAVYREADALRSIAALAQQVKEPLRGQLRLALRDYTDASAAEWPLLAQRQTSPAVGERADALLALLATPAVGQATGNTVQALLLAKASEIRFERDQRIALSQTHVNPLKWLGMGFLGLLTLLSVAVVHVDQPRAATVAILLFALAAAPTAAIVLVQGNPFQPPTAVSAQPLIAAKARF
jgi:hypothetical protein